MITLVQALLLLVGLMLFDLSQRWIATRKPADTSLPAVRPWYGREAVAAQKSRPGSLQLALPMVAVAGLATVSPVVALGILLGIMREVLVWYVLPLIFYVRDPRVASVSNRLFPLEQYTAQKLVAQALQHWDKQPGMVAAQRVHGYTVFAPFESRDAQAEKLYQVAEPTQCRYEVEEGDDLDALLATTGVKSAELLALNRGKLDWKPGAVVVLPRKLCLHLIERRGRPQ